MASSLFSSQSKPFSRKTLTLIQSLILPTRPFCTSSPSSTPSDEAIATAEPVVTTGEEISSSETAMERRPMRGERQYKDRTAEQICSMMSKRPWTTRLQNSIREVSPRFDSCRVLDVLRLARSPDQALQFFRWVEKTGFLHDRETYLDIIRILSQAQMLNHARCLLLDDMPKRSIAPDEDLFVPLLEAYGRDGIPQEVVKLFHKMPSLGVERTVKSYDVFFKAILRRGRGMMAKRAFNAMVRNGVEPTLYTYNIMIWGFCLSEMMTTAGRFFTEMKEKGVVPDVVTYNTMISGWVRAKKMEEAEGLLKEMAGVELVPNDVTYTTLIKGFVNTGNVDDALRIFGLMGENGVHPTEKTYSILLPGLCEDAGKANEAMKILNVMAERHLRPKDLTVFFKLISCLCNAGSLDEALEVLRLTEKFRVTADSSHYGVLLEGFGKAGVFGKAVDLLDEMLDRETLSVSDESSVLSPSAYNPVIEYMCGNGQTKKAELFFRQLMKKGVDDYVAFNNLIRGHASEEAPESALDLFAIMNRRGVPADSDAYILLINSFLKKGEPAEAKTTLDGMIEHGHVPSSSVFRSVMVSLFDDGRVQTASRVMKSMVEKGVLENVDIVHNILEALLMRGHVEEAIGRINLLLVNNFVPEIDKLFVALCDKDKTIPALKLADFCLERDLDISFSSYDRLLEALYNAGKTLNAYSILCKIKKKGGITNKKASAALIKSLIDEGNTKQADILSRLIYGNPRERRANKAVSEAI